ncbi:MAG: hypothetical protein KH135_02625 [Firmicutes bacterium]|nr:hypothetical protein [Bacillota bacterium]
MEKKLPEVFKNKIEKKLNNNEHVYYSSGERSDSKEEKKEPQKTSMVANLKNKTVNQKIQTIFSSPTYVYKADVEVVLKDGTRMVKKVIGKNNQHLITMDNELIAIDTIEDIAFKE